MTEGSNMGVMCGGVDGGLGWGFGNRRRASYVKSVFPSFHITRTSCRTSGNLLSYAAHHLLASLMFNNGLSTVRATSPLLTL